MLAQRPDGVGIGLEEKPGIGRREGRLAQHVIGIGSAFAFHVAAAPERPIDGFAEHELIAQFLHRRLDRRADDRFAEAFDDAVEDLGHAFRYPVVEHAAGEQECPRRGIDQRRGRLAEMPAPTGGCDLVLDQVVHGFGIRHPQQGFGQTHQGNAFVGRKAVFGQERLHGPGSPVRANGRHQGFRTCRDAPPQFGRGGEIRREATEQIAFVGQMIGPDGLAKGGKLGHRRSLGAIGGPSVLHSSLSHASFIWLTS